MRPLAGDGWAVVAALAAAAGAWLGMDRPDVAPPLWMAGCFVLTVVVLRCRSPGLWCLVLCLLAASLAQRSMEGLSAPIDPRVVQDELTLLTDPRPTTSGSVHAEVSVGGRRLALVAHRSAAAALDDRLAGEQVGLIGRVRGPSRFERQARHRHLAGRLEVETVTGWRSGHGVTRAANSFRRTLARGVEHMSEQQRSLLMGLVLGDDRNQPPALRDAFRKAGLTHLLAVSGQNISFLFVVVAPLVRRLRFGPRLVVSLLVLAGFALLTRGEPSVLRATAMAAIAVWGACSGQPSTSLRRLSLAVCGLLLIDPLMVSSLGFQLSVAGSAGIILGAGALEDRLIGPRWLRTPLAVTLAAQLAVAPLLVAAFGEIALASIPANLLAVPAAGPAMVWGLTGGLLAGLLGGQATLLLHMPTRVMLGWLEAVATNAADWPLGAVGALHLGAIALALLAGLGARSIGHDGVRRLIGGASAVGLAAVVVVAARSAPTEPDRSTEVHVSPGLEVLGSFSRGIVVVDGRATAEGLNALSGSGRDQPAVVVVRTDAPRAVALARAMQQRWPTVRVLAPGSVAAGIPGAVTPVPGTVLAVDDLQVRFSESESGLKIQPEK